MKRVIKRAQSIYKHVLWMLLVVLILVAACVPIEIVIATPQPTITISNTAYYTPEPTWTIMPTPTRTIIALPLTWTHTPRPTRTPYDEPTPTEILLELNLPSSILAFSPDEAAVFIIDSTDLGVYHLTDPHWSVMSFDISHSHGRMAVGTRNGDLEIANFYVYENFRRTVDVRGGESLPLYVNSVAWSPDGEQIAYTVNRTDLDQNQENPAAEALSGLWIYTPGDETNVQLVRNGYFKIEMDVRDIRILSDPAWSPDGSGLILTGYFWEWIDVLWLDPISPDLEGQNLIDPLEGWWSEASWSLDGQYVYISGRQYDSTGGVYRIERATLETELIFDSESENLYVFAFQELPIGYAFIYWDDRMRPILNLGTESEEGFTYTPVGQGEPLCDFPVFNSIEWHPSGEYVLISCREGWRLLSLDGSVNVDLAPYLEDLVLDDELELHWDFNPEVERVLP